MDNEQNKQRMKSYRESRDTSQRITENEQDKQRKKTFRIMDNEQDK